MPSPFQSVIFNAREEAVSSDINRAQQLKSKVMQDELMYSVLDSNGVPINCFTKTPTAAGILATFNVGITAGEAIVYDSTIVDPDQSPMQVLQWAAQNLTHANPDPTNGRIDLIVATPGSVSGDLATRNVLQDPVTRAFAPASVPKTQRPTATLSIVTGVASATPLPPAVPAGTYPLMEVFAEPGSTDSSSWPIVLRMFRKTGYPYTGMSPAGETFSGGLGVPIVFAPKCGIVRGCRLINVNLAGVILGTPTAGQNAVCIDGEVIEFGIAQSAAPDTLNPPVGPANANYDLPVFVYVVGGRNLPSNNLTGNPIQMVYSITPPDIRTGRPTAPIGTNRGNTSSAVFVGCGFMVKGASTFRGVDYREDSWAYSGTGGGFFSQNQDMSTGTFTLLGAPSIADEMVLGMGITFPGGGPAELIIGDWEDQYADPGALSFTKNGQVRTRITPGAPVTVSVIIVGLTLVRTGVQAYHIPGIIRLG